MRPPRRCTIEDCDELVLARGWCEAHYDKWRRYGDPTAGVRAGYDLDEARRRLARGLEPIRDPIALARKFLLSRRLLGGRDEEDLMDVAVDAIMSAAIAWEPEGGRSILSWAWLYMDRNVGRELGRCVRRRAELGRGEHLDAGDWLQYNPGFEEYRRAEDRLDLQRWADLAELTPLMRYIVEYAALHHGTILRFTPLQGAPTPLHGSGFSTYRLALKHMRRAALTGQRRDDRWTRARAAGGPDGTLVRSNRVLTELRAVEAARDDQVAS